MTVTAILNCTLYTPDQVIPQGLVLVEDARIAAVGRSADVPLPVHTRLIDAEGGRLTPGLIDLVRFTAKNDAPERSGVTAYLSALPVRGESDLPALAGAAAALTRPASAARPLGLHLIGPWLPGCTSPPDWHDIWTAADAAIAMLTFDPVHAPPGTLDQLVAAGVRPVLLVGSEEIAGGSAGAVAIRPRRAIPNTSAPYLLATVDDDPDLLVALWQQAAPDQFTLSGSAARPSRAARPLAARSLRQLMAATAADFSAVLPALTRRPADLLGLPHGRIQPSAPADLLCWTRHGAIAWTMVNGEIVYP